MKSWQRIAAVAAGVILWMASSAYAARSFDFVRQAVAADPGPVTGARLTAEEYAVLRAVMLPYTQGNDLLVVQEWTSAEMSGDSAVLGAGQELAAAFTAANKKPVRLDATRFQLRKRVKLVSKAEVSAIFQEPADDGWEAFYKQFPSSQGLMTLSRPGFDAKHETAIVHVGNQQHWLAGAGYFFLLKRQPDGAWKVVKQELTWIS